MQEAQAHIEEKRLYTEKILREKTDLASRLEEIQSKMEVEYSKSNFSVKELQVTVDTLKKENAQLVAELREYIGGSAFEFPGVPPDIFRRQEICNSRRRFCSAQ